MVATQDPLAYDFSVSTNYHNRFGFVPGLVSPVNVSYVYPNGRSLTPDDLLINLAKEVPSFLGRFDRVAEIIVGETKDQGREHYKFYRDRGYPLHHHDLKDWEN